jgi:hypothetical protein
MSSVTSLAVASNVEVLPVEADADCLQLSEDVVQTVV